MKEFASIDPYKLGMDPIRRIGKEWMLVSSGDQRGWNTMTASWGGLGELWSKPVAFAFVRPSRYTFSFMEKHDRFSLSFFPPEMKPALDLCGSRSGRDTDKAKEAGLSPFFIEGGGIGFEQAHTVIICEKAYSDAIDPKRFMKPELAAAAYPQGDYHTMYVGVIVDCLCR
jgi:flavin reductase (DIM6/NTAB) family NADH-FMN oxidoreductase RutF